jgi:hypothetical protein
VSGRSKIQNKPNKMSAERILQVNGVKRVIRPEEFDFEFDTRTQSELRSDEPWTPGPDFQGSDEPRAWDARPGWGAAPCSLSNVDENAQVMQQVRDTRGGHQTPRTALKERNSDVLRVKGGSLFSGDVSTQLQRDQILRASAQARVSSEPGHMLKYYNVFARCDTTRDASEFDLGRYRMSRSKTSGSKNGGQAYFEVCVNVGFEDSDEADQQFWYSGKVHNEKDGEKKVVVMFQNVPSPTRSEHMSFLNAAARRILRCMQLCVPEPLSYELPKFQACHVYQLTALPQPARLCNDDLSSLQQWCSTSSDLNQLQLNLPKASAPDKHSAPQLILLEHPDGCFRVQVFKNAIAVHEWCVRSRHSPFALCL